MDISVNLDQTKMQRVLIGNIKLAPAALLRKYLTHPLGIL